MEQDFNFRVSKTQDNYVEFVRETVTIKITGFSYDGGKHEISRPHAASAQFICCGCEFTVENTMGIATVEDWYLEELRPKVQMLELLLSETII